jgi:uncharacterized protein YijF (DUF1287 family)
VKGIFVGVVVSVLLAVAAALVGGCQKPVPAPVHPDASDAAAACTARASVCAYCARMRDLHCPEGQPTAAGASCEDVTENTLRMGIFTLDLACRTRATTCVASNACQ